MTIIKVFPMLIDRVDDEDSEYFGDETGTPKFKIVKTILQKHLGENINVSFNYDDFTFEITDFVEDEGCDKIDDYIEIIKDIDESLTPYNLSYQLNKYYLTFIINAIL